jgi:phosphomannomutase
LKEKDKWNPDYTKRAKMKAFLDTFIPEFSAQMGGATSIDLSKPGIDKACGVRKAQGYPGHFIEIDDFHR